MHSTTPSQTIGPFFAVLRPLGNNYLCTADHPNAITIEGTVFDGQATPVSDALVEVWQADARGHYNHPDDPAYVRNDTRFGGFGRCATDAGGGFSFVTLKPGRVAGYDERDQAPHIVVAVFARGLLRRLVTRLYFPDEVRANSMDPVLGAIADEPVRRTLVAQSAGPQRLRFDIHLQGAKETAFFAI